MTYTELMWWQAQRQTVKWVILHCTLPFNKSTFLLHVTVTQHQYVLFLLWQACLLILHLQPVLHVVLKFTFTRFFNMKQLFSVKACICTKKALCQNHRNNLVCRGPLNALKLLKQSYNCISSNSSILTWLDSSHIHVNILGHTPTPFLSVESCHLRLFPGKSHSSQVFLDHTSPVCPWPARSPLETWDFPV